MTKYITGQQFTKGTRGKPNEQLFPRQVVIRLPKYVTHIIGEPKYKYGQHEQITVRNYNRNTAMERSVLKEMGGLNRFYGIQLTFLCFLTMKPLYQDFIYLEHFQKKVRYSIPSVIS